MHAIKNKTLLLLLASAFFVPSTTYAQDPVCEPVQERIAELDALQVDLDASTKTIRSMAFQKMRNALDDSNFTGDPSDLMRDPNVPEALLCKTFPNWAACACDSVPSCVAIERICSDVRCTGEGDSKTCVSFNCTGDNAEPLGPVTQLQVDFGPDGFQEYREGRKLLRQTAPVQLRVVRLTFQILRLKSILDPTVIAAPVPQPPTTTPGGAATEDLGCTDDQSACGCDTVTSRPFEPNICEDLIGKLCCESQCGFSGPDFTSVTCSGRDCDGECGPPVS